VVLLGGGGGGVRGWTVNCELRTYISRQYTMTYFDNDRVTNVILMCTQYTYASQVSKLSGGQQCACGVAVSMMTCSHVLC
jgi:hypothetical protein